MYSILSGSMNTYKRIKYRKPMIKRSPSLTRHELWFILRYTLEGTRIIGIPVRPLILMFCVFMAKKKQNPIRLCGKLSWSFWHCYMFWVPMTCCRIWSSAGGGSMIWWYWDFYGDIFICPKRNEGIFKNIIKRSKYS